jgi:hypothetical protein
MDLDAVHDGILCEHAWKRILDRMRFKIGEGPFQMFCNALSSLKCPGGECQNSPR